MRFSRPSPEKQRTRPHGFTKTRINVAALGIRMTALDTAFRLRGSYAPRNPKEAEQFGIKVVVVDIPRPLRLPLDVDANGKPPGENNGGLTVYTFPTSFQQNWKPYILLARRRSHIARQRRTIRRAHLNLRRSPMLRVRHTGCMLKDEPIWSGSNRQSIPHRKAFLRSCVSS